AGRNMYDSFSAAADDLAVQYEDADIVNEVRIIKTGLDNGIQIEDLLLNFADRSGIEDIRNFANVFATCYKKGGNIKDVIKNTTKIIGDKIEIQMELETMVAGTKNEMNVMLVLPVIFIIVMKTMGGEMIDLKSGIGMISVTIALVIFIIAFFVGKKITNIHF
ncbi:MAG: type II secretion system F family protein, partial [Clostridia bacterium]|nr:type II secretion system F family protein [Clostridia bacterium]